MQYMTSLKKILLGAAFLSFTSYALAVTSVPYGWYLEGNVGSTELSKKSYPGSSSSSGIGGNADIGYKFMPFFGLEIGYTQYATTSIDDQFGTQAGKDKHYAYDLAARGILPVYDSGLEAFAKLGVQRISSSLSISNQTAADNIGLGKSSHSQTGVYIAVGGQYYFIPELAVNVQWARAEGSDSTGTLSLLSGGISFIFD